MKRDFCIGEDHRTNLGKVQDGKSFCVECGLREASLLDLVTERGRLKIKNLEEGRSSEGDLDELEIIQGMIDSWGRQSGVMYRIV